MQSARPASLSGVESSLTTNAPQFAVGAASAREALEGSTLRRVELHDLGCQLTLPTDVANEITVTSGHVTRPHEDET